MEKQTEETKCEEGQKPLEPEVTSDKYMEYVKNKWDNYAVYYASKVETMSFAVGICLINTLELENAGSILDCGCGSGLNSTELIRRKNSKAQLCLSDLSEGMLNRAKYRISTFISDPTA